jgi:hypothetical protein
MMFEAPPQFTALSTDVWQAALTLVTKPVADEGSP